MKKEVQKHSIEDGFRPYVAVSSSGPCSSESLAQSILNARSMIVLQRRFRCQVALNTELCWAALQVDVCEQSLNVRLNMRKSRGRQASNGCTEISTRALLTCSQDA